MSLEMKIRAAIVFIGVVAWLVLRTPRKKKSKASQVGCKHVPWKPPSDNLPHAEVVPIAIGGSECADVKITCAKCYCTYTVCRIDLPAREAERRLIAENRRLLEKLSHFMEGI